MIDKNGMNLLHHAVLKGVEGKTQLIIDFVVNFQNADRETLLEFLNSKTLNDGWTALHYASFAGNLDAIYSLIQNGADYKLLNLNGLNMLHVAA